MPAERISTNSSSPTPSAPAVSATPLIPAPANATPLSTPVVRKTFEHAYTVISFYAEILYNYNYFIKDQNIEYMNKNINQSMHLTFLILTTALDLIKIKVTNA